MPSIYFNNQLKLLIERWHLTLFKLHVWIDLSFILKTTLQHRNHFLCIRRQRGWDFSHLTSLWRRRKSGLSVDSGKVKANPCFCCRHEIQDTASNKRRLQRNIEDDISECQSCNETNTHPSLKWNTHHLNVCATIHCYISFGIFVKWNIHSHITLLNPPFLRSWRFMKKCLTK